MAAIYDIDAPFEKKTRESELTAFHRQPSDKGIRISEDKESFFFQFYHRYFL